MKKIRIDRYVLCNNKEVMDISIFTASIANNLSIVDTDVELKLE